MKPKRHIPLRVVKAFGTEYWEYNFKIGKIFYELSIDKINGDLWIVKDGVQDNVLTKGKMIC